jgi:signal peptidase II
LFKSKYFLYILICIVLDLLSKHLALNYLNHSTPIEFIPFIDFYLTFNSGVAFGFLDLGSRVMSNMLTFAGILIVVYILVLLKNENDSTKKLALSIIIGGALGNIFDRLPDGYVTDFLHLKINNFSFFIFNIADASITIGAVLLIYLELFKKDNA